MSSAVIIWIQTWSHIQREKCGFLDWVYWRTGCWGEYLDI